MDQRDDKENVQTEKVMYITVDVNSETTQDSQKTNEIGVHPLRCKVSRQTWRVTILKERLFVF